MLGTEPAYTPGMQRPSYSADERLHLTMWTVAYMATHHHETRVEIGDMCRKAPITWYWIEADIMGAE